MKFWRKAIINNDNFKKALKERYQTAKAFGEHSFVGWLSLMLKSSAIHSFFALIIKYFRRFRLVRTIFVIISYIVTFLGTGVALIFVASLFLFILPITVLVGFAIVFVSFVRRKKVCAKMKERLAEKAVCIFFPAREPNFFDSCFFVGQCREMSSNGYAVLVVTPFFISQKGISGNKMYLTVREDLDNVFMVRRYIFFALRRNVLERSVKKCIYFY